MTGSAITSEDPPAGPFGMADVVTATTDEQGIVTGWSEGARRLLGYRPEDVVGRPAAELLAEDVQAVRELLVGRQSWSGQVAVRHRDGRRVQGELLAHRRVAQSESDWLLVWGAARGPRLPGDGIPVEWCFDQAPCILAIFDTDLRFVRTNADEERAVGLTEVQLRGMRVPEAVPHPECERIEHAMRRVVQTGERQFLEIYLSVPGERREHAWAIHLAPLNDPDGRLCGVCFAAQDTTEQYEARQRLLLLNEAGTRIGSSLDMTVTAQQLAELAVPRLADFVSVDLLTSIDAGGEPPPDPVTGPVTMRRAAQQSILQGVPESAVGLGEAVAYPASSPAAEWLAAGMPAAYRMTDPAVARWADNEPTQAARLREVGTHSMMVVPLRARGTTLGTAVFIRHRRPEPFERDDLLLAEEITARAAVCIDNARRYTRERTTAVTLQHSLLPQRPAEQTALEVASRYLPASAQAGVGGDWFDVIPLSGARVALVIGDVVGHGIQASAVMGRLRTAVRTLADIDLPPDELLTRLDDLVIRLSAEAPTDSGSQTSGAVGATCLYAVYDPISRRCTLARAGHFPPAVSSPDGTVDFLDLPAGPPLGLGGLPFEAAEVELPEGSILALYTNGLIDGRDRDTEEGLHALRHALAQPADSLQTACDAVLDAMPPGRYDDDIALLLARTRALPADQVATWDVLSEPSAVAQARKNAFDQLTVWGLEELSIVTELVVSELVTNAIRYGQPPIQLRLIHDRSLICEVRDHSNTAPRLRRARVFDEGGRGLLLIAQLTQRWGTRYTRLGKTIWAEQDLPARP
ncbi:SpoIIE family protein phosphatase [Streptomyces yanii]|uniref:SpoIIE family protein phosphatase n=1 Tax=Streptomyces yanii TaxID=78510 RepID=A0ABV5R8Z9_9ACTN